MRKAFPKIKNHKQVETKKNDLRQTNLSRTTGEANNLEGAQAREPFMMKNSDCRGLRTRDLSNKSQESNYYATDICTAIAHNETLFNQQT